MKISIPPPAPLIRQNAEIMPMDYFLKGPGSSRRSSRRNKRSTRRNRKASRKNRR